MTTTVYAGRFDFEDGGTYCGGWEDGKAHGHGVCTGPKGMGEFSGVWQFGYEVSGIYIWPSGNCYQGQWMSGKRHGLGVEKKQRWIYKGEWSQGFKGRYGVRVSEQSGAKYEGTWANGLQDGYGSETYADTGTYYGQMAQGMRNGYGIRKSVAYGAASRYRSKDIKDSLTSLRSEEEDERTQRERDRKFDENRGGFVLRAKSDPSEEIAINATQHGGIVTTALSSLLKGRRNSLGHSQERRVSLRKTIMSKFTKQKSVSDIDDVNQTRAQSAGRGTKKSSFRSTSSNNSVDSRTSNRTAPPGVGTGLRGVSSPPNANLNDDNNSFISQDEITDINCIEIYMGEWKQDKRTGFGIAERSDGLKYEGEWFNNKKNGYGVTTFKDGTKEEGKYKNNVLITDKKKGKLGLLRTSKHRERIDNAVNAALKAAQIAQQRADIALSRAKNARAKAEAAELAAKQARMDSEVARLRAHEVAPDFVQPGEIKKMPEIFLDIDKHGITPGLIDIPSNNISPMPYRRPNANTQLKPEPYMNSLTRSVNTIDSYANWQQQQQASQQQQQQRQFYPASTPPVMRAQNANQIGLKPHNQTAMYNDHPDSQYYPNINSSNHNQMMQHPIDMQKQVNDMMGMNHLDPQLHIQLPPYLHPSYVNNIGAGNLIGLNQYNQYSPQGQHPGYDDPSLLDNNNRMLLHNQQNYSVDIYSNQFNNPNMMNQNSSFDDPLNSSFQRNNPKRGTFKRSQRVIENSIEDFNTNTSNSPNIQQINGNRLIPNNIDNLTVGTGSNNMHGAHVDILLNSQNINNNNHSNNNNNANTNNMNSNQNKNETNPEFLRAPSVPRRKSLPSIVKNQAFKEDEIAHSSSDLNNKIEETFIIENGIRKRITEKSNPSLLANNNNNFINNNNNQINTNKLDNLGNILNKKVSSSSNDDTSPKLPRKIVIESITSLNNVESKLSSKRVSMPSINALLSPKFANKVMSREEANRLSSLQREHIRKYGKDSEKSNLMKLKSIFPDCLNRHRLFLAIIIFNISLAIWFFQLLK